MTMIFNFTTLYMLSMIVAGVLVAVLYFCGVCWLMDNRERIFYTLARLLSRVIH